MWRLKSVIPTLRRLRRLLQEHCFEFKANLQNYTLLQKHLGGNSSAGKVFLMQALGPEFKTQNIPTKAKRGGLHLWSQHWGDQNR